MGERFLIDTNVLIDFQNGTIPAETRSRIKDIIDKDFVISFITYIEFLGYNDVSENLKGFVSLADVIQINNQIIDQTIAIRKAIRIKLPDAIIAATAIVRQSTLITRNLKDFQKIEGLEILNPYSL